MPNHLNDDVSARILVIDDNPSVHEAFDEILRRGPANEKLEQDEALLFGVSDQPSIARPVYQTNHALSGAEGIEKVQQALAANQGYQVAFVDIRMPGMDGVETIERLWELDARIQTVICTAYADYRWEDLAKRLGQTDRLLVLKKPFHNIEVMQLASTLAQKWFLARSAEMKIEQAEALVAQRTQKLMDFHQREHQRIQELDQIKLRHLTNLAQQFRDPLTVMLHAIEGLPEGKAPEKSVRETLQHNLQTLVAKVDDSLLMRQMELADRQLDWAELEIVAFVRGLVQMFAVRARERSVKLAFSTGINNRTISTDRVKLEKAFFNVLSRALLSAGSPSQISIELNAEESSVNLLVKIQLSAPETFAEVENDAGLLLSREILQLLSGGLAISRAVGAETGKQNALHIAMTFDSIKRELASVPRAVESVEDVPVPAPVEKDLPVILLLEPNEELRAVIRQELAIDYSVIEAADSAAGLTSASDNVPDLVVAAAEISPKNGVAFCAALKQHELTSHISVILLAADHSDEGRLSALEAGADDFLAKPFRLPLLKARVQNLLENRRKLHEHFQQLQTVQPRELALNQLDAEFLRRVVEIVEKNLADYEFDVEKLARQLALSRRQLFRKFKALAGCTPNVFIRDIRLRRAAQLLRESRMTVSEIIYAVGFSDPKYFRNIFRERFGVLPGEYNKNPKNPGD